MFMYILTDQFKPNPGPDLLEAAPCIDGRRICKALLPLRRILMVCRYDLITFITLHRAVPIIELCHDMHRLPLCIASSFVYFRMGILSLGIMISQFHVYSSMTILKTA